jgi:purine-cytosine permease-like protein
MGMKIEDTRALITMIAAVLAAYLPFYVGLIKYFVYPESIAYYLIIECIQAVGGIAISIYFSVRRIEGVGEIKKREPLGLPKHGIRAFLLINATIAIILGVSYFDITQDIEMLNLPFVISMIIGLIALLWPPQRGAKLQELIKEEQEKYPHVTRLKQWEIDERLKEKKN